MAREPTDEDVVQFCDFAGLDAEQDRSMVASALKSNYNMEQLLAEYYDDPSLFRKKYAWDETVFAADRDGATNNTGISFNIESPDNAIIQGVTPPQDTYYQTSAGAPSRPPSRTNNRSPLARLVDWNVGDATGMPNNAAQEEEHLQRALRESAAESGVAPQEAGITDTNRQNPYFGPANRDDYDQNDWAMVPVGVGSSSKAAGPALPSARKREPGAPAFLVQQPNSRNATHRLGALITILHEIPLVRNVLLRTGSPSLSYGYSSDWWKGQPIYPPHVLYAMQQGELSWAEESKPNFNEEIHRVMAFLDLTERSYGSIENLADLVQSHSIEIERQFYETLTESNPQEIFDPIIQKALSKSVLTFGDCSEPIRFGILEMELTKRQYESISTLYEAWDALLWNDALAWNEIGPDTKMAVLHEPGEVMVVMLGGDGPSESIEIPEVWYPERYLESRQEEARSIQEHLAWTAKALYHGDSMEYEYTKWVHPQTNKVHDKRDMLRKTIAEYERHVKYLDGLARFREAQNCGPGLNESFNATDVPRIMTGQEEDLGRGCEHLVQRCKYLLSQIEEKMEKLEQERQQIRERRRYLGQILTDPDRPGLTKPFTSKKFLLRGVATARDVVYVCKRAEPQLIELGDEAAPLDQWWRLAYVPEDAQPVKAEKVTTELVMRQMFQETKKPILVYATEAALNTPREPLSDALQRFVRAENKNFRQELNQEASNEGEYRRSTSVSPLSPSKRKYRSGSVDSMATNRASLGNSDTNSRAGDFDMDSFLDDDGGAEATELAEMPHRASSPEPHTHGLAQMVHSREVPGTSKSYDQEPPTVRGGEDSSAVNLDTEISRTVTPDLDGQPRTPEMQERGGTGSIFVSRIASNSDADSKPTTELMDMDIPLDHQN